MVTAYVFSGGGSLAAVQVGAVRALAKRGIHPDLLVGTSAGSLNAAFVAGRSDGPDALDQLTDVWAGLRRSDLFPVHPVQAVLAGLGRRSSLCSPQALTRLLEEQVSFPLLEHALIPLHVVTTDVLTGGAVVLDEGDTVEALLASCAVPGILPPVRRAGRLLCDGALAGTSGIAAAVALGADVVYLLPGGTSCALQAAPRHPVGAALHAVTLLLQQRALLETRMYARDCDLHVIPPLCPLSVSSADFDRARYLIGRSYEAASRWLDAGADSLPEQERFLSLHAHTEDEPEPLTQELGDGHAAL
jgi:NTE family protein